MTSFDQMAARDPVGAAACRDAGRFGETAAPPLEEVVYRGTPPGSVEVWTVEVWEGSRRIGRLEQRVVRHSPDGFSWGYGGSGPAELALNLIVDALGADAWCSACEGRGSVTVVEGDALGGMAYEGTCEDCRGERLSPLASPAVYQAFKAEVVALWPMDGSWQISRREVASWVRERARLGAA